MKKQTTTLLALLLTLVFLVSGCATTTPAATASAAPTQAAASASAAATVAPTAVAEKTPVTLSIMWWGPDARHKATLAALDAYTKANSNVTFKPEYTDWDSYWTKLPTLAASNALPDVMQMDGAYIKDYVKRGTLADLSDMNLKDTVPQKVLDNIAIDGKIYGVPLSHNAQGMAYNKKALDAAGIAPPKKDWTYDDYWAFALECRQKLAADKWGIPDDGNYWDTYQYYQTSMGKGSVFTADGLGYNIDKDLWMAYYSKYAQFRKDNVIPPAEVQLAFKENDPQADQLASGKVMIRLATVGSVSALEDLMPGSVGVVNLPTGPAGSGWAQSTIFFASAATSKNTAEAKLFMKWFISDVDAGTILGTTRGIPISEAIYKTLEPNMKAGSVLGKELLDVCLDKALPFYPAAPSWDDFTAGYKTEVENLMFGNETVQQAYDNIIKLADQVKAKVVSGK